MIRKKETNIGINFEFQFFFLRGTIFQMRDYIQLQRLAAVDVYQTAELILDHFIDWLHDAPIDNDLAPLLFYKCFIIRLVF